MAHRRRSEEDGVHLAHESELYLCYILCPQLLSIQLDMTCTSCRLEFVSMLHYLTLQRLPMFPELHFASEL